MIAFDSFYRFSASEVEYIEAVNATSGDHPYRLTVHFKSGQSCSVSYADKKSRDSDRDRIVREIEHEIRCDAERTLNMITLVKYAVERIDKRQLRIWRQLKALLGVQTEEDTDG